MRATKRGCTRTCRANVADNDGGDEASIDIELQTMVTENKETQKTSLQQLREHRAEMEFIYTARGPFLNFLYSVRSWTLFYGVLFAILVTLSGSALPVTLLMKFASTTICWKLVMDFRTALIPECRETFGQRRLPTVKFGALYGFILSLLVCSSYASNGYTKIFRCIKPCQKLERIIHELRYETRLPEDLTFDDLSRPLQVLGLDNSYMCQFQDALEVHFDRYSRNETDDFAYIKRINLIGNLFDYRGVECLARALGHPHAYTTKLLMGRNRNWETALPLD